MALRTNVVSGTLAGPWAYNDYLNLLTGAMQDQLITVQGTIQSKALGGAPTAPTLAVNTGGSVDVGAHTYAITFVSANGETKAGTTAAATTTSGNQTIALTSISTGPAGTSARKIYRSKVGTTSPLFLVTTLNDNSTTSYNDSVADSTLPATQPPTYGDFGGALEVYDSSGNFKGGILNNGVGYFDAGSVHTDGSGNITANAFHGPADSANSVAPGNITSGTLAAGVTVPFAQVTSGYPAGNIGSGTLASGVHLTSINSDGGNVTSDGSGNMLLSGQGTNGVMQLHYAGTGTSWRAINLDGTNMTGGGHVFAINLNATNQLGIYDYTNGGNYAAIFQGGVGVQAGGRGNFIQGFGHFFGTGAGTFNHNAGTTPNAVTVSSNQAGSAVVCGIDTPGSTTVHVDIASGAWNGMAFV
jgi:hypothetical protein